MPFSGSVCYYFDPLDIREVGLVPWSGEAGKPRFIAMHGNVDDKPYHISGWKGKLIEQIDVDPWDGGFVGERTEVREGDGFGGCPVSRESRLHRRS